MTCELEATSWKSVCHPANQPASFSLLGWNTMKSAAFSEWLDASNSARTADSIDEVFVIFVVVVVVVGVQFGATRIEKGSH